ncbi:MAG: PilZ domain-containing protein [Cycloclasticus sp.]|nr:PilZ domain-containing protein [Cycloclasticus sp.]MBQ0789668.1 PilZ domain-containing protein [Cycloclasticus sp.]
MNKDKRRFQRIFHDATGRLINTNNRTIPCEVLDISLKGCLLSIKETGQIHSTKERLELHISLTETLSIDVLASVVYIADNHQVGLEFDDIDIDSVTELRRLVELNIGEQAFLERDLLALCTHDSSSDH